MTTSDAPQPPGGPLRQDGAEGDFAPDEQESGTAGTAGADGSDRQRSRPDESGSPAGTQVPDVHGAEPGQDDQAAERQEENAETSTDQPSS